MDTPKNVQSVLKKLKKSDEELANYCISNAAEALQTSGYKDSRMWAATILHGIIPDMETIEDGGDFEEWLLEVEGIERDVLESIYEAFSTITDSAPGLKQKDVRDAIVYTVTKVLDIQEREKYKKMFG